MSLAPGKRFGVYELLSPIGAGGMGEIYRAHDARLGRDVAIKILPPGFAGNAELLSRFDREAKAIASLNHPHICTVHDVGHDDGVHYLVMELIDGESLAQRLGRGPLPVEQVLRYGAEIATALDAAHRKGITHRDLKPGNVMITRSGAKLLDFGLAKAAGEERGVIEGLASGLTEARPLTAEGTILGTFQYMAPEQLEGSPADARTDIFALGTLLYEMATARRAFEGSTKTSLIAAIVSAQPAPISQVVPMTPPALDHVVRKCLEKDPDERWQSAHDVASELRWISEAGSQIGLPAAAVRARKSQKLRVAMLAIIGWIAAITALGLFYRERTVTAPARDLFRSDLVLPAGQGIAGPIVGGLEISPDGTRLLLVQESDGIAIHDFRSGTRHVLDGTRGGKFPFWSTDGEWFAFFADGKLKKIRSSGGPVQVLCDAAQGRGGSWNRKGIIVFAPEIFGPLMQVQDSGGVPTPATTTDDEWTHRNPRFLPDGDHFLFTATSRADGGGDKGAIAVASLSDPNVRMLDVAGAQPQYADGYLFYVSDRNLIARQFDPRELKVTGSPQPIADHVDVFLPRQTAHLSVSSTGVLAYQQRFSSPAQLFWTDRSGRETVSAGEPGNYGEARASGDGKTAVLLRREDSEEVSVWLMDLSRGNVTRVTRSFDSPVVYAMPSYDGRQVAVSTLGGTALKPGVWIQKPSATAMPELLLEMSPFMIADWSQDGRVMIAHTQRTGTGFDILWIAVDDPTTVNYFSPSAANEWDARLSPDGRWLAYSSNETGSNETYISDFPEAKQRWQVTRTGGSRPIAWSADGSELFYGGSAGSAAVTVREIGGSLEIGDPTPIPHSEGSYVLWGDGDRFLIRKELDAAIEEPVRIVRNWKTLLEK